MRTTATILPVLLLSLLRLQAQSIVPGEGNAFDTERKDRALFQLDSSNSRGPAAVLSRNETFLTPASPASGPQSVYFQVMGEVKEGKSGTASIRLKYPETKKIKFRIQPSDKGMIISPSSVTIAAGATECEFAFFIKDDKKINLTRKVELGLYVGSYFLGAKQIEILDDEKPPELKIRIPSQLAEGGAQTKGTLTLDKAADVDLNLTLKSSPQGQLEIPKQLLVRAGSKSLEFKIRATDDSVIEPKTSVKVTAGAPTMRSVSAVATIADNENRDMKFTLPTLITEGWPSLGTVRLAGRTSYDIIVKLKSDGENYLTSPRQVTIPAGQQSVSFPLVAVDRSVLDETHAVSITATAAGFTKTVGKTKVRETFENGGTKRLALATNDLIWDAKRERIYASVPSDAGPPYGNHVVAIDPLTRQITAKVAVNQEPGQLALTSGGEALYVAQNGNGRISKIALPDFKVSSSFAVGSDPYYGTLYAEDICTVKGQPDLLVVSQYRENVSPQHNGVAVYDRGIIRPLKTQDHTGSNRIEPSTDPTIFYGYCNESSEFGFRRLKLGANGMTELDVHDNLISGYYNDIRSDGDTVFDQRGVVVDGKKMVKLGSLPSDGLVCPDLAGGRVYLLTSDENRGLSLPEIVACDPTTLLVLQEMRLDDGTSSVASFIRWGEAGFAFRTGTEVFLVQNRELVPSGAPADVVVTVTAGKEPATVGTPLTYVISAKNEGTNIAYDTKVSGILSNDQKLSSVSASHGNPLTSGRNVSVSVGDLAPGETKSLKIVTIPESAGLLSCNGAAFSQSTDPHISNNSAVKEVGAHFRSLANVVNQLRLPADNLVYDAGRAVFWASVPSTEGDAHGKSIVSIDPLTGIVSTPLPVGAETYPGSMALSSNGRYLYLGLLGVSAVHRVDLATAGYPSLRIPLGDSRWGHGNTAQDIEVLAGDGTSFIIAGGDDHAAAVYDGMAMRPSRSGIYSVDRIEPSGTPGVYIGYNNSTTGFNLSRLSVTTEGVTVLSSSSNVISGFSLDLAGSGGLVLSSNGRLVDSGSLTLRANLGAAGAPCVDPSKSRAYLATTTALRAFDTITGNSISSIALPLGQGKALKCVRWGTDGFGVLGDNGRIYIARWSVAAGAPVSSVAVDLATSEAVSALSSVIESSLWVTALQVSEVVRRVPQSVDSDNDGISDDLEYLFGTSSTVFSNNPLTQTLVTENGTRVHLKFPRRAGVRMPAYSYEISSGRRSSTVFDVVEETVVSTQVVDGIEVENVEAVVNVPSAETWIVRLRWNP